MIVRYPHPCGAGVRSILIGRQGFCALTPGFFRREGSKLKIEHIRINGIKNPIGYAFDSIRVSWLVTETAAKYAISAKVVGRPISRMNAASASRKAFASSISDFPAGSTPQTSVASRANCGAASGR